MTHQEQQQQRFEGATHHGPPERAARHFGARRQYTATSIDELGQLRPQAVTLSRCHVVCGMAAVAAEQYEVPTRLVTHGGIVNQVGRASSENGSGTL